MPTTQEEAEKIVAISQEFVPIGKLAKLYIKLDDEVGQTTENDSLKTSLNMMRVLMESRTTNLSKSLWLYIAFCILVWLHAFLVIGMMFAFMMLPFVAEWYIALPLDVFIWFFSTSQFDCKLTNLENYMRRRFGMKEIKGFVGNYFVKPIRMMFVD